MATFDTLDDFEVAGTRVLVRLDLNVPMADGKVSDLTRIERSIPTVAELSKLGARVVVLTHFGRPKGERQADLSLAPIADAFSQVLGRPVAFAEDCIGSTAAKVVDALGNGDVALLENLRFHAGRSWRRWTRRSAIRRGRWRRWSAAPRSRPSSTCCKT